jgi:hypothetical protein
MIARKTNPMSPSSKCLRPAAACLFVAELEKTKAGPSGSAARFRSRLPADDGPEKTSQRSGAILPTCGGWDRKNKANPLRSAAACLWLTGFEKQSQPCGAGLAWRAHKPPDRGPAHDVFRSQMYTAGDGRQRSGYGFFAVSYRLSVCGWLVTAATKFVSRNLLERAQRHERAVRFA